MLKLEPVALTDVGRKRSNNQDHLGDLIFRSGRPYGPEKLAERGWLFAVADGMGGYAGGEVASELAITTLFREYYESPSSGDIATDLTKAVQKANFNVRGESATSGRNQMGTTLTLVLITGNRAIFGNVGDSRTYLIRQGIPERVTHDHSLVQDQIDAGVLTPEQAERSSIRNFITRAIGHKDEVDSDLFERELIPGDVLLLCSDGLHGLVKEIEMGTVVATSPSLKEAAQALVDLANERGGPDNISVMLIRVEELGDILQPILNEREARYDTIFNQVTGTIPAMKPPPPPPASITQQTTTRNAAPVGLDTQTTRPMQAPNLDKPKPGGSGLIIGLIILALVIAAIVIGVVLLGGSNGTSNSTAVPSPAIPTPTVTLGTVTARTATAPAATTVVAPPATATPLPGSSNSSPVARAANAVAALPPNTPPSASRQTEQTDISALKEEPLQGDPSRLRQVQIFLTDFDNNSTYRVRMYKEADAPTTDMQDMTEKSRAFDLSLGLSNGDYRVEVQKKTGTKLTTLNYSFSIRPGKILYDPRIDLRQDSAALYLTLK